MSIAKITLLVLALIVSCYFVKQAYDYSRHLENRVMDLNMEVNDLEQEIVMTYGLYHRVQWRADK